MYGPCVRYTTVHVFTMSLFFCHSEFLIPLRIFAPIAQRHNYSTSITALMPHLLTCIAKETVADRMEEI